MSRRRGLPWLLLAAALLFALFAALGSWQVQRLGWKQGLIARTEARVTAAAVPAPGPADWPAITQAPLDAEYRRVQLQGEFLHTQEALVQASTTLGAGFWVLTPLRRADGSLVLVNRGFVPPDRRDPTRRGAPPPAGTVSLTGLLRLSEPAGGFLRNNDPAADRWFSRDVAAIAAARGLPADRVAPYFIDAEASPAAATAMSTSPAAGQQATWPVGGLTVLRFTNNHLVYAFTWYTLALMVGAAAVWVLRDERRRASTPPLGLSEPAGDR